MVLYLEVVKIALQVGVEVGQGAKAVAMDMWRWGRCGGSVSRLGRGIKGIRGGWMMWIPRGFAACVSDAVVFGLAVVCRGNQMVVNLCLWKGST